MSSHREAPEIAKDPVADSADTYCFVSPDDPSKVTLIANYVPLQGPAGGPNFFEFGDNVLYEIHVDNTGDGKPDVTFQFRFTTINTIQNTFLYNLGPITAIDSPVWNRKQFYSVTRVKNGQPPEILGNNLPCPPCNVGPLSTPNYAATAASAIKTIDGDIKVFCGQRADAFYVDLGAVFDLADLRPFQQLHTKYGMSVPELDNPAPGVNALRNLNVHTIAIQVPKTKLSVGGINPTNPALQSSVIGMWTTASRQPASVRTDANGNPVASGPFAQVSRLGNPLVNEALIPIPRKDYWNKSKPYQDSQFAQYLTKPELSQLLPALYPGAFPHLADLNASNQPRNDILAILHTGLPPGIVPGFQNFTGGVQADMLRLNMAIAPAGTTNNLGIIGGDLAGFPNGRRVYDDVFTIELRALAGATYPLVNGSYTPDGAAGAVTDGNTLSATDLTAKGTVTLLPNFPYIGTPHDGYHTS